MHTQRRPAKRRKTRRLATEKLESRRLLAALVIEHDGIGYFVSDTEPTVKRYDLAAKQWKPPIQLLSTSLSNPTTAHLDDDGIYVAYDKAVFRYDLDGNNRTHLVNTTYAVESIHSDGSLLIVNYTSSSHTRALSIDKTNNTVIDDVEDYLDTIYGASIDVTHNRLFGRTRGTSPSDITYLSYDDDGKFLSNEGSAYHGAYPGATQTWVFPSDSRVVDDSGTVYATESLQYLGSLGTNVTDIDFLEVHLPIVLSNNKLTAFSNAMLPTGEYDLEGNFLHLMVDNGSAFVFTENGLHVEVVDINLLTPDVPSETVDPVGLAYTAKSTDIAKDGSLLLFVPEHQSIFRWDPLTEQYAESIPLIGVPQYMTYSTELDRIYLAYPNGLIRSIDLAADTRTETPFVVLPSRPFGLESAGEYLFAMDPSGAWGTHYTFSPAGELISSREWSRSSKEFVWSPVNGRIYQLRDGTSPNDLHSQEILSDGTLGQKSETPEHGSSPFQHPVRVSPSGDSVVLGSGFVYDAWTLVRKTHSLSNSITDAAWIDDQLFTIHKTADASEIQRWGKATLELEKSRQQSFDATRLVSIRPDRLLVLSNDPNGVPQFEILNSSLEADTVDTPNRLSPRISWGEVNPLSAGTAVTESMFNVSADVEGTFIYSPSLGDPVGNGTTQELSATFVPADTETFNTTTATRHVVVYATDFGDLPASLSAQMASQYPVTLADGGARHSISDLYLGSGVDADPDGSTDGFDDDADDDNSVTLLTPIFAFDNASSTGSASFVSNGDGYLHAWIDFNRDGDWDDAQERVARNRVFGSLSSSFNFPVPSGASIGETAMRVRISNEFQQGPNGFAVGGEVEDSVVTIRDPADGFQLDGLLPDGIEFFRLVGDVDVHWQDKTIANYPNSLFEIIRIDGTNGNDSIPINSPVSGLLRPKGDFGEGFDSLEIRSRDQHVDLTQIASGELTNIEQIDIRSTGPNQLTVDVASVISVTDQSNSLSIVHDDDDTIHYGGEWKVMVPQIDGDLYYHVLNSDSTILRIRNERPFSNPVRRMDADRSNHVTPGDILTVINWLSEYRSTPISNQNANDLYVDVSGDLQVTPADILEVINYLSEHQSPIGQGEQTDIYRRIDAAIRQRVIEEPLLSLIANDRATMNFVDYRTEATMIDDSPSNDSFVDQNMSDNGENYDMRIGQRFAELELQF
ncbi:MAG: GEVED domain-containing protein [Pirellulaceae bacterium]